ncbi:MAG: 50S ribosomal protein L29 [Crocinitomicaceae bacterium]|jgi:large subunit ribosomal protein L29|nr:50S ribosomal protein L29 [Crocinitomicaceae bacterium]|tara:strand:+ start:6543 stop:6743 length:201 start_codon:yes stop_codon:yes gene_type:complete
MKQSVIKELKTEELFERLEDEMESLTKLKINHKVSQLESPVVLKDKRKTIARLNTEITKRSLEQTK